MYDLRRAVKNAIHAVLFIAGALLLWLVYP